MTQSLNTLIWIAGIGLVLIVLTALFLRWVLGRIFRWRGGRRVSKAQRQTDKLLTLMGNRMERPWMVQELMALTDLSRDDVEWLLRRGQRYVRREIQEHPVTGEEFEALMLNRKGVRKFGKYAPDDTEALEAEMDEDIEVPEEEVDPEMIRPVVTFKNEPPQSEEVVIEHVETEREGRGFRRLKR